MLGATLLALGSAVVHAGWNLLIKTSDDRAIAAWGQFLAGGLLAVPLLLVVGPPGLDAVPYLVASAAVHALYLEGLVGAYTHGDFSLSYPMARGGGAVLAALGAVVLLDDVLPAPAWVAIAVAAAGLVSLRLGGGVTEDEVIVATFNDDPTPQARDRGQDRTATAFALFTAVCIAAYSLIDSAGARATDGVGYGLAVVIASAAAITGVNLLRPDRRRRARALPAGWRRHVAGGIGTTLAYTMVLVAVRHAPVGYVTMLRESSVVIGALAGWLLLGEALGGRRLVSAAVILAGLVGLVAVTL